MRAILYYVEEPQPIELHGLQRLVFDDLSLEEARTLMLIPAVRQPGVPMERLAFRGREYVRHEDNRVLIHNHWGITDIHVADRRSLVTMLIPAEDLAGLLQEAAPDA
jgi:hypothetical protein